MRDGGMVDRPDSGRLFAALDLGTSNCRMMLATPRADGPRVVESVSRVVRLGEDLPATGLLSEAAMDRTLEVLRHCADRAARRRVDAVDAVATEACRSASNAGPFLARIRAETGFAFRTISAREEAALVLESCAPLLSGRGRRAILFDIGGGSTEIGWVRLDTPTHIAPELIAFATIPFGVVTLPAALGVDPFEPDGFERAVAAVGAALQGFDAVHRIGREIAAGGVRLAGTSGTVTTLAGEAAGLSRYDRRAIDGTVLPAERAIAAVRRLRGLGRAGLALHPCVGAERVELVLAGCAIFEAIRRRWRLPDVLVADRGLREGLLARMIRNHRPRGARSASPPAWATRPPQTEPGATHDRLVAAS